MSPRILVFTKDRATAALLNFGLEKRGHSVSTTDSKKRLVGWATTGAVDVCVVDASLDLELGLDICHRLRKCNGEAYIVLATPTRVVPQTDDVDVCFVAPVTLRKVQYRLNALDESDERFLLRTGVFTLDIRNRLLRKADTIIRLRPKEARLLQLLMQRAGETVTRREIVHQVWDTEYMGDTRTLDVHIRWLRRKLEPDPAHPTYICTVRRQGYRFVPQPQDAAPVKP